jgi:hypothetical protein
VQVGFTHNGKTFDSGFLNTSAVGDPNPDTYAGLRDALKAKLVAQGFGNLVVEFGSDITTITTRAGVKPLGVIAKQILIRDPAGLEFSAVTSAAGATNTEATSDVASRILPIDPSTSTTLIESNLILDNAGRGSTAGDVMIGAMSNSNAGVEKFNVFVDRESAIESLGTTNNKLKEIVITSLTGGKNGSLEIAQVAADNLGFDIDGDGPQQTSLDLIDASGFKGANLMLGKSVESDNGITGNDETATKAEATAVKNLKTLSANIASNVTFIGSSTEAALTSSGKAYSYITGSGKDVITYALDGDSVDSKGESMAFNVGDGDNTVTVELEDETTVSYSTMAGLKNLSITSGSGADRIINSGVGRFDIKAGGGSDTVIIESRNDADVDGAAIAALRQVSTLQITTFGGTLDAGDVLSVDVGGVTYSADTIANLSTAINGGPLDTTVVGSTITVFGSATGAAFTIGNFSFADAALGATANSAIASVSTTVTGSAAVGADVAGNATTGSWNISVTDEDGSASLATFVDRVLYQAKLTVNFAGFESQVTVQTTAANGFVATQMDINSAIKAAIDGSSELKRLLAYRDTTDAKGLTITSTVEGQNDLTIDLFQPTAISTGTVASNREVLLASGDIAALRTGLIKTLDLGSVDSTIITLVADDSNSVDTAANIALVMNTNAPLTSPASPVQSGTTGDGHLNASGRAATDAAVAFDAYSFLATASGTDGKDETNVENFSVINMGAGANDLVVLNSDSGSANTLVFNAAWDKVSVVNFFDTNTGNGIDGIANDPTGDEDGDLQDAVMGAHILDFKAYLDDVFDGSAGITGNTESGQRVATIDVVKAANALVVDQANNVIIVNTFEKGATTEAAETWAALDAVAFEKVLENVTIGTVVGYGALGNNLALATAANAVTDTAAVSIIGGTIDTMFFVENDDNQGEYKVFNVEWTNAAGATGTTSTSENAVVTLVGIVDFGESITASAVFA